MSVRCGIIGAPNAGKSTLYNALTKSSVPAESFPFCTIEPNIGSVAVPDARLEAIANVVNVDKVVPVVLEFVDIAGLVDGASRGEGLGNRFLSHIREMDVIAHVVGCFDQQTDWRADIETVNLELLLADLGTVTRAIEKTGRKARVGDKSERAALKTLTRIMNALENGERASSVELASDEVDTVRQLHLISAKRKFYIFNVDESKLTHSEFSNPTHLQGNPAVAICAELESELAEMPDEEQELFRTEIGYDRSAIDSIVHAAYSVLNLSTFYTFNENEVRGWAIARGTTARQAAGRIHTDMERGFIRVEVMACEDLISAGSEQAVKKVGKLRIEGKTYQPQEGEILRVRFNT